MRKIRKILIAVLILALASFSLIKEDFLKFLLTGHSATYEVELVEHSPLVVFGIAVVAIFFLLLLEMKKRNKYFFIVSIACLILSLRTIAVFESNNRSIVVSGFSFVQTSRCEVSKTDGCDVKFGFFLGDKVNKAIAD